MISDKEIGEHLLKKGASPLEDQTDSLEQASSLITRRAEWRFRMLWILAGSLWVLTAVFFVLAVHGFFTFIFPLLVEWIAQVQTVNDQPGVGNLASLTATLCLYSVYICSILFVLSAAATIFLVVFSRRATLRQIQSQLAGISEQFKQLSGVGSTVGEKG